MRFETLADERLAVRRLAHALLHMMTDDTDFPHDMLPDVSFSTDPPMMEKFV